MIIIVTSNFSHGPSYISVPNGKNAKWLKIYLTKIKYMGLENSDQILHLLNNQEKLRDDQLLDSLPVDSEKKMVVIQLHLKMGKDEWKWDNLIHNKRMGARPIKRVLCVDGGGVRGLATIKFLVHLEEKIGQPLSQFFDLFAGTSTGSLICLSLGCLGKSAKDLEKMYTREHFARMMPQTWKEKHFSLLLPRPKYDGKAKYEMSKEIFGDLELQNSPKHVMAVAYNLTLQEAWIFTNKSEKVLAADAVSASAAAPGLFPPVKIGEHWFIDGSVAANDPTLCAYSEAISLYGDADIRILSIGTGISQKTVGPEVEKFGSIDWLSKGGILGIFCNNSIVQKQAEILLGSKYVRVNSHLISPDNNIDNYSEEHIETLKQLGSAWWQEKEEKVLSVLLGEPTFEKPKLRHSLSFALNSNPKKNSKEIVTFKADKGLKYLKYWDNRMINMLLFLLLFYFIFQM